jgi:hypothetical protein
MESAPLEVTPLTAVANMKNVISVYWEVPVKQDVSRLCCVVPEAFQELGTTSAFNAKSIHSLFHLDFQHASFAMYQPVIILGKGLRNANFWSITLFWLTLIQTIHPLSPALRLFFAALLVKMKQTTPKVVAKAAIAPKLLKEVRVAPNL